MIAAVREAYDTFITNVNEFDVTTEGITQWKQSEKVYATSTSDIETQFAILIKDKLSKAPTPKDKFNVFSFYN